MTNLIQETGYITEGNVSEEFSGLAFCARCTAVQHEALQARAIYTAHGFSSPDAFVGCSLCGSRYDAATLIRAIDVQLAVLSRTCLPGVGSERSPICNADRAMIEVMCHPGYPGKGWDDFNRSQDRLVELRVLQEPSVEEALIQRGLLAPPNS